ncbi:macrodomain Ter protein [Striga asiatica]|uniref:Macrodomain Ter protein n=1 Tax=Striga asiatica TaxID=4170 RepID=A0A5A7QBL0_STRAF|nr:macrodomain Ter protein [Striga asiatica]
MWAKSWWRSDEDARKSRWRSGGQFVSVDLHGGWVSGGGPVVDGRTLVAGRRLVADGGSAIDLLPAMRTPSPAIVREWKPDHRHEICRRPSFTAPFRRRLHHRARGQDPRKSFARLQFGREGRRAVGGWACARRGCGLPGVRWCLVSGEVRSRRLMEMLMGNAEKNLISERDEENLKRLSR